METCVIIFENRITHLCTDLEVPLDISADELVLALAAIYQLGFHEQEKRYLYSERPNAVLSGSKTLRDFGLRDASCVYYTASSISNRPSTNGLCEQESCSALIYPNFMRSTRIIQNVDEDHIEVLPPKTKQLEKHESLFPVIFPTIGMALILLLLRGSMGGGISLLLYSAAMAVVTLVSTLIARRYQKKRYIDSEKSRREHYLSYLRLKINEIVLRLQDEIRLRNRIHRPLQESLDALTNFDKGLFDRSPQDKDFINTRIGTGMIPAATKVTSPKQEYVDTEDVLLDLPHTIQNKYNWIDRSPVILHLKDDNAVGIIGTTARQRQLLREMTLDLCLRQYAHELHLYFLFPSNERESMDWVRWLPHCRDDISTTRNIIFDEQSAKTNLERLFRVLSEREESHNERSWPDCYVVFVCDNTFIRNHPISKYFEISARLGVTFVFFCEHEEEIPRGCNEIIHLDRDETQGTLLSASWAHSPIRFTYPIVDDQVLKSTALRLAPIRIIESNLEASLVKSITLFQLLNVRAASDINFQQLWANSKPDCSLRVALGVKMKNEVVTLDVHEKADGPHGLVAGTTGSGKSELLQSYLINIAVHFHPHEVGFIIIDFKGGGMANQLKGLPHLLGVITNMEGHEVARSLKAIRAELMHRQDILAQAGVNNLDDYLRKRKENMTLTPIPHLLIVVDEFAELKAEQPDFMRELISAARIGRSLGIHLVLATQKPSGVVDAQIWSNSRFKICLKVQDKEDSNEVLHTPLAAEIREPGRAYVQVGNSEIFELFQSAYSGTKVYHAGNARRFSISEVNLWGGTERVYSSSNYSDEPIGTELELLTNQIRQYCNNEHIKPLASICLPPLPEVFSLEQIHALQCNKMETISVCIGLIDDPENQKQEPLFIDVLSGNIFILGASQSGKTTLLETMIVSMARRYTAQDVALYIIDFNNSIPKTFGFSRIIGGICYRDEEERIGNLLTLLEREYLLRRSILAAAGVGSFKAYLKTEESHVPAMVVMVDNIVKFKEIYEEKFDRFCSLLREGTSLGVYYVVTSLQSSVFFARTMIAFEQRIALHCNDMSEYTALFDHCRSVPSAVSGRGLIKSDKRLLEIQVALPVNGDDATQVSKIIEILSAENIRSAEETPPIPMIPDILYMNELPLETSGASSYSLPLGLRYSGVVEQYIDLQQYPVLPVIGRERSGKTNIVHVLLEELQLRKETSPSKLYILDGKTRSLSFCKQMSIFDQYGSNAEEGLRMLALIVQELEERQELSIGEGSGNSELLSTAPMLVMVIGSNSLLNEICASNEGVSLLQHFVELYRYKAIIVIDGMANASLSFSAPDVLRTIRDNKCAIITEDLENVRLFDLPIQTIRKFNNSFKCGDAFIYTNGQILDRTKVAWATSSQMTLQ